MRIWDIPTEQLCNQHLLGEHRELHAIMSIHLNKKNGYRNHPETKRWGNMLDRLAHRHDMQVVEMERRGMNHASPVEVRSCTGEYPEPITPVEEQRKTLMDRCGECRDRMSGLREEGLIVQ